MARIPTQLKAASGYTILVILLFATVRYIYGEMTFMTRTDKDMEQVNRRWLATYDVANKLYRLEIASQPMSSGLSRHYPQYERAMREANNSIDSLKAMLNDSIQTGRLDSVKTLLREKDRQTKDIYAMAMKMQNNSVYQKHIDKLIAEQDTIVTRPKTFRDTITKTQSYAVRKKEGFFKRLRNVFVPSKADSTHVSQVTTKVSVDSTEKMFNPADTVATMLKAVQDKAEGTRHDNIRQLDNRTMKLLARGQELNNKVNALMEAIEAEEHALAVKHAKEQETIQKDSAKTISAIAVAALLLAVFFLTIIWRDITKSNHYRRELEKAKSKAEDLLEQREQLMLTITHDIKAPVGSLLGYTDLLETEDAKQKSYIASMKASARHLLDMVCSLLDYHRLDANKMDLNLVAFRPRQLFSDIYESFKPMTAEKNIEARYRCDINDDIAFVSDPSRIRQITENLLSNALKFTDKGSISLTVGTKSGMLHICVEDTGRGIAPEDKERMFREFTRLTNAQGQEGFGLGLSITRKMTHLLGGNITVESTLGKGSKFMVCLPMEERAAEDCMKANDKEEKASENTVDTSEHAGKRLLIIDDDRLQLRLTTDMLATKGINAMCCTQPEEMLEALNNGSFDAVMTDIQMPAMNGLELIRHIRTLPREETRDIPVIAVTARSDINAEELKSHGFSACLHKPYNMEELLDTITCVTQDNGKTRIDFSALTAFAGDDHDAAREIIETFIEETKKNKEKIETAAAAHDATSISATAHKMLPLFIQIGAKECTPSLEWLEAQRGKEEYSETFGMHTETTIRETGKIIAEAERLYLLSS